jgi:hypothetical protein
VCTARTKCALFSHTALSAHSSHTHVQDVEDREFFMDDPDAQPEYIPHYVVYNASMRIFYTGGKVRPQAKFELVL